MERLPRLVLSSVTMLPPQLYWLPLLAALLPPVPAQKFSALTVSPEPHLCLPHSLGTHSPLLWDKVLGAGGRVSSNRWVWQSPMAWVFRVYSYSHVKGCWSYQYREEGSWHTGMSGAAPPPSLVGMDESRDKYLDHQSTATVSGRTHSNWAPTLPMPTHLVVRKRAVFSLGATRTHCSPFSLGKEAAAYGLHLWQNVAETLN